MKKIHLISLAVLAVMTFAAAPKAVAGIYDQLTPAEQAQIMSGQQVVHQEEMDGSIWPKFTVFKKIDATPVEVMAIFTDYGVHKELFSGRFIKISKSEVAKEIDPYTCEVDYIMGFDVPGLRDKTESYSTINRLYSPEKGRAFELDWKKIRAQRVQDIQGGLVVEPFGNVAIIAYFNFINPPDGFGPLLNNRIMIGKVKEQVQLTVDALDKKVVSERVQNPAGIQAKVNRLRNIFGF